MTCGNRASHPAARSGDDRRHRAKKGKCMTGTSRVLRRLGVAGLGAVVVYSGLVPLTALTANAISGPFTATNATSVSLSAGDTAGVGTCNPFTITVGPAGSSVSVNIQ